MLEGDCDCSDYVNATIKDVVLMPDLFPPEFTHKILKNRNPSDLENEVPPPCPSSPSTHPAAETARP